MLATFDFCPKCGTAVAGAKGPAERDSQAMVSHAVQRLIPKEFAERLLATRGQVQAERRMVTILFSDVKGSTAMAEELDPEYVMEIMDGAFDVLIEPIARYEGTLARLMGDAVLAFFGAPITHEDDPERAILAALEIVEGVHRYAEKLKQERGIEGFDVRVGINTGLVVVGEVGSDLRVEYTAMGDAVNLAARTQSAAEPGTVLITEGTHRLVAPLFKTEALGPIEVRGKTEQVSVYRVVRATGRPARVWGLAGMDSPLVGRKAEWGALQQAIQRLDAGVGGIATVVGDAGIGKSRLVAELRKGTLARGSEPSQGSAPPQWVEGRCLSYGTSVAYGLWLDVLRGLLGVTVEDSPARVRDVLRERVKDLSPESFDEVCPYLGRLMSLPLTSQEEMLLEGMEGEMLKAHTFSAVEELIARVASDHPLALVCEDLHWADPTSVELLEQLLALTDRAPLLLVCVFRPEPGHGSWRIKETAARLYRHRHTDLWLDPLSAREGEVLVGNLLDQERLDAKPAVNSLETVKRSILDHAGGNPFYVEEIIRALIDGGSLARDLTTGRWEATGDFVDLPIPDSVQGLLVTRVDRLPEEARRVLQVAAVVGRIFPYRVLAAIAGGRWKLDDCLITLQREGMIRERRRLPEPEYIFKHDMTREAAYDGLLKKELRSLHRRVAEALERLLPDRLDEQPELLAHHWECAQDVNKATWYLFQAGERARRLGTSLEAVEFYRSAAEKAAGVDDAELTVGRHRIHERLGDVYLENLSRLDDALEQYGAFMGLSASDEDAARAARKVATVHLVRGDLARAQEYYETALKRLDGLPLLAETGRVHYCLAYLFASRNQLDAARRHAEASLHISRELDDTRGLADAHRVMGMIADHLGHLQTAGECAERSLELYRQVGDLPRVVAACNNVGEVYRRLGQPDRALARLEEGLEIARRIGGTRDEATLLQTTAELLLDQAEWQMATEYAERAVSAAEESGVASRIIESHRVLGAASEAMGRLNDARHHLEIAEKLMTDTEQSRFAPAIYLDLAQLAATQGHLGEAHDLLQQALMAAGPEPPGAFVGLVHRCHGYVHSCDDNWEDAVAHLESSLRFLEPANLPAEVGRTRLSLGVAYASRGLGGDRGRACEQLLAALSLFQQMKARGYVAAVEKSLEELGCRNQHPGTLLNMESTLSSGDAGTGEEVT